MLVKENAEPFGGVFVGSREGEGASGNVAAIVGNGEGDGVKVRGIGGANEMKDGSAFGVDPLAVDGI